MQARDKGIVRVEAQDGVGAVLRADAELFERMRDLAVAVELVAEDVREDDDFGVDVFADELQRRLVRLDKPGILPQIILVTVLGMGNILNAGFDQVFNLYSPIVYQKADILDTYVYRLGMLNLQYSVSTAVGLFKSVISFILIASSFTLAKKFANYRIF